MRVLHIIFFSLLLYTGTISGQDNGKPVNQSLSRPLGSLIIYYGKILPPSEWACFEVWDEQMMDPGKMAELITANDINHPFMISYEWKAGMRWEDAAKIAKAFAQRYAIQGRYTKVNGQGKNITPPPTTLIGYNKNAGEETEDYVNKLETYAWMNVNKIVKKKAEELEASGWKRKYAAFNLIGGPNTLWIGKAMPIEPGMSYTIISAATKSNTFLKVLDFDKSDSEGVPFQTYFIERKTDEMGLIEQYSEPVAKKKVIMALVSADLVNTSPGGILVYAKPYSLKEEFETILAAAKDGFTAFIQGEMKSDVKGGFYEDPRRMFSLNDRMIYQEEKDKTGWVYSALTRKSTPETETLRMQLEQLLSEYHAKGVYKLTGGFTAGNKAEKKELISKEGKLLFSLELNADNTMHLRFFGNKEVKGGLVAVDPVQKSVTGEQPGKKEDGAPGVTEDNFLDKSKKYLFTDWISATTKYKWDWLETPYTDEKIHRFFVDSVLTYEQKSDGYSWAIGNLYSNRPASYTYTGRFNQHTTGSPNTGAGLMLLVNKTKKEGPVHVLFIVSPVNQTWWFGSYNPNNNEWKTYNKYTGTAYNINSNYIQKMTASGSATNQLSVQKQGDKIFLYINGQLVETVEITKKNSELNVFSGLGIATNEKGSGSISRISFSAE